MPCTCSQSIVVVDGIDNVLTANVTTLPDSAEAGRNIVESVEKYGAYLLNSIGDENEVKVQKDEKNIGKEGVGFLEGRREEQRVWGEVGIGRGKEEVGASKRH